MKTAEALQRRELHFMGIVKTAHKGFPKEYLGDWAAGRVTGQVPGRGDHILLESQVDDGCPIYAMGWNDRKLKLIVSTCGTTVASLPSHCP